jgi:hypothetical protein
VGDAVLVGSRGMTELGDSAPLGEGRVAKVYPEIEGGRVMADVEVEGLGDFFVGERTRVWVPVASRSVIAIPLAAITTRSGIDYVQIASGSGTTAVPVLVGERIRGEGPPMVEILSGLADGDRVVTP